MNERNVSRSRLIILTLAFVQCANLVSVRKYLGHDFVLILQKTTASIAAKRDGVQLRQGINESDASEIVRRVSTEDADKVWYYDFINVSFDSFYYGFSKGNFISKRHEFFIFHRDSFASNLCERRLLISRLIVVVWDFFFSTEAFWRRWCGDCYRGWRFLRIQTTESRFPSGNSRAGKRWSISAATHRNQRDPRGPRPQRRSCQWNSKGCRAALMHNWTERWKAIDNQQALGFPQWERFRTPSMQLPRYLHIFFFLYSYSNPQKFYLFPAGVNILSRFSPVELICLICFFFYAARFLQFLFRLLGIAWVVDFQKVFCLKVKRNWGLSRVAWNKIY